MAMIECCTEACEAIYRQRFPLGSCIHDDWLRSHLMTLAKKWGQITQTMAESFYVRSVPRRHFFDARTFPVKCANGHVSQFILLGSRVYYLAWRINLICGTFFKRAAPNVQAGQLDLSGDDHADWPLPSHVEQLRIALRVYLQDDWLSNDGFEDLEAFAGDLPTPVAINQEYIGDLSLLFLLMHEIQHVLRMDEKAGTDGLSLRVEVDPELPGKVRASRWSQELSHDANAALTLLLSVISVLTEVHNMTNEEARMQGASLVVPAADLALHVLQHVEEQRFGTVTLEDAAFRREFARHPPSEYRRKKLSQIAYQLVTRQSVTERDPAREPEAWRFVSQNTVSQILIRDRLFDELKAQGGTSSVQ